ncbi:hypothetical protein [Spirosoma sordidisoli]|uniref:Uncharacterized protein n=1 Tax=Spirosoma sordidisoli TaxID=2502893 RepID=A0A4Q2UNH8_9BACT|nr:hypothetical protein [Spirosoma sordidisoli]RYC70886.1 hypothetical protein EQG79_01665 [Spirosoma sordidisoli]
MSSYDQLFETAPANDDPSWCSTQSVGMWVEFYQACQFTEDELLGRLEELLDGTYVPQWTCEIPLRIAALQQLLGLANETPTGWVCPTCAAREKRKQKPADQAQTSLF